MTAHTLWKPLGAEAGAVFFENMDVASVLDEMLSEMCREAKAGASTGGR
jgi:hypothetical protein